MNILDIYNHFCECDAVTTDSREVEILVKEGRKVMFFALKGDHFDGNKYALNALSTGAAWAVIDDTETELMERLILVDDVLSTMTKLACEHRKHLYYPHLAITGSNGKTTTKELLQAVLSKKFNCYATSGNLNNHIGVPLTILRTEPRTDFSIIEMGANHCGEIAHLCEIAQPKFGLITNIGRAHLEGFGGADGVKRGKGELFDYLERNNGMAFWMEESDVLTSMISEHKTMNAMSYNASALEVIESEHETLTVCYNDVIIRSRLVGEYNKFNIMAAIHIGSYFDVELQLIKEAIEAYEPSNKRSQLVYKNGCHWVMDAYNANPSSMELSISNFDSIECARGKIIVLGDMKELGDYSHDEHCRILRQLECLRSDVSSFVFVGDSFRNAINDGFNGSYEWFASVDGVKDYLTKSDLSEKYILVKGSNSTRLYTLVD